MAYFAGEAGIRHMRFWGLALAALLAPVAASAAATDGFKIPSYGDELGVQTLWLAPDGHPIPEFSYNKTGPDHVICNRCIFFNFYDPIKGQRLFPKEANSDDSVTALENMAYGDGLRRATDSGQLDFGDGLVLGSGAKAFKGVVQKGGHCNWLYNSFLVIQPAGHEPAWFMIAVRQDHPVTLQYARCGREDGPRDPLTPHYKNMAVLPIGDGQGGFWASGIDSPYVIHFDRDGHSDFFKGRDDVVLLVANPILQNREDADASPLPGEGFMEKADSIIDAAARKQMRAK